MTLDRILRYAAEHPSGVTAGQVARELEIPIYQARQALLKHGKPGGFRSTRAGEVRVYLVGRDNLRPAMPVKLWPHVSHRRWP